MGFSRSVCDITKKGKPIKCHFVGKWSNITEDRFKDVINKQNLKECVFAHGAKYDNEKDAFLQKADIFVFLPITIMNVSHWCYWKPWNKASPASAQTREEYLVS